MNTLHAFRAITIFLFAPILISQTSCIMVHPHDNGKHKGWYKNSNNPHHPHTTNPGKSKGKHKK